MQAADRKLGGWRLTDCLRHTVVVVARAPASSGVGGRAGAATEVLLVEDDPGVAATITAYLEREEMSVTWVNDGLQALRRLREQAVDIVVLDLVLPGLGGWELCRQVLAGSRALVLVVSALDAPEDRVMGLELGVADYITKPCSPREVVLRVRRLQERAVVGRSRPRRVVDGELCVDLAARSVRWRGREVGCTRREFDLLAFLVDHPGEVYSRAELLRQVWGWKYGDETTVTVHVQRLRAKLEEDPATPTRLLTVRGAG